MPKVTFYLVASVLSLLALAGCQGRAELDRADYGPLFSASGQARSLVLPADGARSVAAGRPLVQPWYVGRNDSGPSVSAGYRSTTFERSVTYTRDRQSISNGRVFDRYDQTTYRRSVRDAAR